jgi:putative ABC transport system permease protein
VLRITTRRLLAGKRRLAGTALAVFLGVSFLAGTLGLSDTPRAHFADLFATASSGIDLVVRSAAELSADGGQGPDVRQRGSLDASVVDRILAVDGVAAALPSIEGYGQLLGAGGRPVGGTGPPGAPPASTSWPPSPRDLHRRGVNGGGPERRRPRTVLDLKRT